MDKGITKIFGRVGVVMCIAATMMYATGMRLNVTTMGVKSQTSEFAAMNTSYEHMSTAELEKVVEKLTLKGDVPFEMGVELMKRWSRG